MKLYQYKTINCGFIVICPNLNFGQIKTTINSIKHNYPGSGYVCIVPENCREEELQEVQKLSKTYKGGKTITSLINEGYRHPPCIDWNFLVVGGSWVRPLLDKKYCYFIENEKDILFPVAERKTNFVDGTINGILLHRKAFKDIGAFSSDNPLEICKLMWTIDAIDKGYKFKAIVGTVIC